MSVAPYQPLPPGGAGYSAGLMRMQGPRNWSVELHQTCFEDPATCLLTCCCPPCMVYRQRQRLLAFTGEPYSCCAKDSIARDSSCLWDAYTPPPRMLPPVWPPLPGQEPEVLRDFQPELCLESVCCVGCALGATREVMKQKFAVSDSDCDLATICCVLCICWPVRDKGARHLAYKLLMGCLHTQQEIEFRIEEAKRMAQQGYAPASSSLAYGGPVATTVVYPQQGQYQQQYQQQGSYQQGYGAPQQQYQPNGYGAPQQAKMM